jgi:hypothetical protein
MKYIMIVIGMCCSTVTHGLTVDLRAQAIESLDGAQTLVLEFTGIAATITAAGGVTNRTRSGFGVNAPGGADDADAIDGGAGAEAISVQFSEQVRLVAIALSGFGRNDVAELALDQLVLPVTESGLVTSALSTPDTRSLAVRHIRGNGFSLDRIEFDRIELGRTEFDPIEAPGPVIAPTGPVAAPAPGVATLSLLGFTLVLGAHRRRGSARRRALAHCGT